MYGICLYTPWGHNSQLKLVPAAKRDHLSAPGERALLLLFCTVIKSEFELLIRRLAEISSQPPAPSVAEVYILI